MLKYIRIAIFVLILSVVGYLISRITQTTQKKAIISETIKKLPAFSFKQLDNKDFTEKDLSSAYTSILVIYFNTTCDHCQYEAQEIHKNKEKFSKTQILFVSDEPTKDLQAFQTQYKLSELPNLSILEDKNKAFGKSFGITSIPSIFVYDANKNLKKHLQGGIKIELILKTLE